VTQPVALPSHTFGLIIEATMWELCSLCCPLELMQMDKSLENNPQEKGVHGIDTETLDRVEVWESEKY
jgi:hypothetical protein